jgi:hypothetical protein
MCVIADALLLVWTGRLARPDELADDPGLSVRARGVVRRVRDARPGATRADLARMLAIRQPGDMAALRNCGDVTRRELLGWCSTPPSSAPSPGDGRAS